MEHSSKLDLIWKNQRTANFFSYLLIAGMMVCFSKAIQHAGESFFDGWRGGVLPWLAFIFSMEGLYTHGVLRRRGLSYLDREFWLYRAAEWVVLILILRIFLYTFSNTHLLLQDIQELRFNFFAFFNDHEFLGVLLATFVIWTLSVSYGADIDLLQARPTDVLFEHVSEMEIDRQAAKRNILGRILSIGAGMVILTVVVRLNLGQFFGETGSTRSSTLNIVVYFALALILLSVSQFALLRGRWLWEGTPIHNDIASRWVFFAAGFLVFIIIVAMILPTRYTFGFLEVIRIVFEVINYIIGIIFYFLILIFSLISALLISFLGGDAETIERQQPQLTQLSEMLGDERAVISGNPTADIILSLLFWIVFVAIILLAFGYYIHQNEELLTKLRSIKFFDWSINLIEMLLGRVRQWRDRVAAYSNASIRMIRRKLVGMREPNKYRYISLRKLTSQDKIIFYYLALIRRSSEKGLERKIHQTPHQYMQDLRVNLPTEAQPELETMTNNFMEARYSQHPIQPGQVSIVQKAWDYLRQSLRKLPPRVSR